MPFLSSDNDLIVVVLFLVLLLRILALIVLQATNQRFLSIVVHLCQLYVRLEGGDGNASEVRLSMVPVLIRLVHISRQFLNL